MQDRLPPDRRKPLATRGRTIHMGQTEKNSVQPLVKPPFSVYAPWLRSLQLRNASGGRAYSVVCTENFIRVDDAPDLIRQMSTENLLWGAARLHAELLKLGLNWLNQASPGTWSSTKDHQTRSGGPFCETTRRTLPPWICSLSRQVASECSTAEKSKVATCVPRRLKIKPVQSGLTRLKLEMDLTSAVANLKF